MTEWLNWTEIQLEVSVIQLCLTLCDPMDCSLPGSFVHGILQARILQQVTISFTRGSFQPWDWTQGLKLGLLHCKWFFTHWATREVQTQLEADALLILKLFIPLQAFLWLVGPVANGAVCMLGQLWEGGFEARPRRRLNKSPYLGECQYGSWGGRSWVIVRVEIGRLGRRGPEEPTLERRLGRSDMSDENFYMVKILEPPHLGISPNSASYFFYDWASYFTSYASFPSSVK